MIKEHIREEHEHAVKSGLLRSATEQRWWLAGVRRGLALSADERDMANDFFADGYRTGSLARILYAD